MKILWLANVSISEIAERECFQKNSYGGWIQGLYNTLSQTDSDNAIVFVFPYIKMISGEIENKNTKYYSFVESSDDGYMTDFFSEILHRENPDVIHIFGTEYLHSFAMVQACSKMSIIEKTVVSIQGLVSIYARHMYNNLPTKIVCGLSVNDLKHGTSLKALTNNFIKRGYYERRTLEICHNISGRTDWDRQCSYIYNKKAKYFYCGEVLRDSFYQDKKWNKRECESHSVLISQCNMTLKGAHNAIEAVSYLISDYADIRLYIAGDTNVFGNRKYKTKYDKYLEQIIKKYGLSEHVIFLGKMSEEKMRDRILKSHVFVCPSSIENSSNSVCEAMICGTPTVASYVGGMVNLINHGKDGFLFQSDAPYMIAYYVRKIFENDDLAIELSKNAIMTAEDRHSKSKIVKDLKEMYNCISKGSN